MKIPAGLEQPEDLTDEEILARCAEEGMDADASAFVLAQLRDPVPLDDLD